MKTFAIIVFLAAVAYASGSLRQQDLPEDWVIPRRITTAQLLTQDCPTHPARPCIWIDSVTFGILVSTGAGPGQSRREFTGTGP